MDTYQSMEVPIVARGNGTAEAPSGTTEGANGEAGSNGTDAAKSKKVRPDRSYIVVPVPAELKARFEEEAKTADKPVGPYVRDLLAEKLGITIEMPTTARRSKYENDEQRKAAQKARNQTRSGEMRDLMKLFREAKAKGANPEDAARIASQGVLDLIKNGPSPAPAAAPEGEPAGATA